MTNNDILKRLRYSFNFNDTKMISLFLSGGIETNRAEVSDYLKKDDDPAFKKCSDGVLAAFLNGLIIDRRGKRDGEVLEPEKKLNNNIILMKLKIALSLKAEDIIEIISLAGTNIGKHELSAFFRNTEHPSYRECRDQILRNFLKGLQLKFRPDVSIDAKEQIL
jgi:uncharacterized protein YehS (DUF1456 family)